MARAVSTGVAVTYGFITVLADLFPAKATDGDSDLTQLCADGHDPTKPIWDPWCPSCNSGAGQLVKRATLVKGHEVAKDTYVVITADEVKDLKSDDEQYKGRLALTSSEAVEVEANTLPSGTLYYLAPGKKDQFYGLLREMVLDTPDLAYVGMYTVRSRAAMYRVRPMERNGQTILLAEQLLRPAEVSEAPAIVTADVPDQMREMALQVARGFVTPFDPDTFRDTYKDRLAATLAEREATGGVGAAAATTPLVAAPGVDPMAAMQAQMQAFLGNNAPAAPEPAAAKPKRKRAVKPAA